jgi:very-short-patch-repair endonuclease
MINASNIGISTGRRIKNEKLELAKQMRREMTYAERCFWNGVRGRKLHGLKFRRQQIIDGFIADFYCNELRLIVEIDGGVHETQKDYDKLRDRIISRNEIKVIRFSNELVVDQFDTVAKRIGELRPPSPGLPGESLHRDGHNK